MNMIECHVKEKVGISVTTDEILTIAGVALGKCAKIDWLLHDCFIVQKREGNVIVILPSR
jgi:hypothetical protein